MAASVTYEGPSLKNNFNQINVDDGCEPMEEDPSETTVNDTQTSPITMKLSKWEERTMRFGTEAPMVLPEKTEEKDIFESLGIDEKDLASHKGGKYRLSALHVRGVNDMSTSDIFGYFKDFGFPSVEWINDVSCNVVWQENSTAIKALLTLSKPILKEDEKSDWSKEDQPEDPPKEESALSETTAEVVIFTEEEGEISENLEQDASDTDKTDPIADTLMDSSADKQDAVPMSAISIPVPPGPWRYAHPHSKAKALLMRFAMKTDRKLPGAEKRSEYYLKYGNPNYGGMKGIISTSRKRKFREDKTKDVLEGPRPEEKQELSPQAVNDELPLETADLVQVMDLHKRSKKLRMKMYADEEVAKPTKRKPTSPSYGSNSDLRRRLDANKEREPHRSSRYSRSPPRQSREPFSDHRSIRSYESRTPLDLRSKLRDRPDRRRLSPPPPLPDNGADDLRSKLDRMRRQKKNQHRSPLVIKVLEDKTDALIE